MIKFQIVHTTEYRFPEAAWDLRLDTRLRPLNDARQQCTYFQLVARPPVDRQENAEDLFGNPIQRLQITERLNRLTISAFSNVTVNGMPYASNHDHQQGAADKFLEPTDLTPIDAIIAEWGRSIGGSVAAPLGIAQKFCYHIHSRFDFRPGATTAGTHAGQVLAKGHGVCQDFTHLAIAGLRSRGVAARYVSGYLHTAAFRGQSHRMASDASHAWCEVFDHHDGWVGFDPTHGRRTDHNYIVLARGRDYTDANPMEGTFNGGGPHVLHVSVDVQQIA